MSTEPPNFSSTSPALTIPAPSAEAMWSAAPPITGVPALKPALRRALIRDGAEDFMRGDLARQRVARDMRKRDQRIVERVRREVDESGLERPVLFDGAFAGKAPVDIVVGAEHGGDAREDLGLMPLDPSELRRDKLLIDSVAGLGEKRLFVDLGAKLLDFRAAARVALLDAGPQQAPGRIEKHHSRQHSCHADSGDVGCGDSGSRAGARARFRRRCSTIARDPPPPSRHGPSAG